MPRLCFSLSRNPRSSVDKGTHPPIYFVQVFILRDFRLTSSMCPRRGINRMIRTRRNLHRGHRGTEDTEKHPARGSSLGIKTSAPASPGAVEKEVGCPFIRKDRNWECAWYRRANFLASVDRQITNKSKIRSPVRPCWITLQTNRRSLGLRASG